LISRVFVFELIGIEVR